MIKILTALPSSLLFFSSLLGPSTALPEPSHQGKQLYLLQEGAQWDRRDIPVCWEPCHAWGMDAQKEITRRAVLDSWGSLGKVNFTGWGTCRTDARGIRIAVEPDGWPHSIIGQVIDGRIGGMVCKMSA
jgi:hypothetical protein